MPTTQSLDTDVQRPFYSVATVVSLPYGKRTTVATLNKKSVAYRYQATVAQNLTWKRFSSSVVLRTCYYSCAWHTVYVLQVIWNCASVRQLRGCISPWYLQHLRFGTINVFSSIISFGCQSRTDNLDACQNSKFTSVKQLTCFPAGKSGVLMGLGRDSCRSLFGQNLGLPTEYRLLVS